MKLHLPTALRRALLAITALLSPAVVTTTIATATLAAITAPTMAEDLDLTLKNPYEFSGDVSFDSVTTGSPDDSIKATASNSTFTANTVSVGTGHMLTVEGYNRLLETYFTVKELNVAEGGFINFTDGTYVLAASGVTLYDLFKGVSSGSVKGKDFYIYGAGHSAAETEKLVKSSDLFGVLHSDAQGFIKITEGNLIIDADHTSASGGKCYLDIGDEVGSTTDAFATIISDVTRFDELLVDSDGKLTIEKASEKLTLKDLSVYGLLESHRDLVLEGYCKIEGTLTLGGTIENNGTVQLVGWGSVITVDSSSFAEEHITRTYTDGDNGYLSGVKYTVITGVGTLTGGAFWRVDDMRATYDGDGKVTVVYGSPDTSVYYVASGTIDYGTDVTELATDTTKFCMKGGSLVLSKDLKDTQGIKVDVASSVSINNDVTLKANQLDTSAADVTLSGSGSYTLESGANALNTGLGLSDTGWSGVVNTTGDTTALELDKLGVSGSKVVLGNASHTLAARAQEVAADLNSTGSMSLSGNKLTLSGENTLGSLNAGSLAITGGSTTITNGLTTGGESSVATGATLSIGGVSSIGGKITLGSGSTLVLAGTITLDDTAFTAGTRERYSAGNNGYKITDTTYTVLTGGAVTGTATWKVGTQSATYENGMVIVAGIEDTAVYYVRNGDVAYTRTLANDTTTFSLDGGHLVLNESLKDTQSIEWKSTASWLNINNAAVELKSSQLSTVGAGNFTLIAPVGGTYIIDKKVGDIVELTLGTGVTLSDEHWWGWVKTVGDTTVSSNLDTTDWKNTELNGTTTVNSGVTLTLGGNTKLKGQIVNNGSLVLGGNIDVPGSMTHTSKATFATTGDASDLGTESGSGFASSLDVYSVVEGNSATGSATWTVDDQAAHYDSGKVSLLTGKDTTTWWMNTTAAYSTISGNFVTGSTTTLALNTEGGTLQLDTDPGVTLVSKKASTVEIGYGVTLNAARLNASAADVTLSGSGSYTMENGANTLGSGVSVGAGWSGVVNTTGNTTALELDKLGVSGSKVVLGNASHTLAARHQEVAADLNSTGSMSLSGNKLTLSGENTLGSLNAGSLAITGGSTTITNGLTTGGESSVATGATLSIGGNSTLGGKISNSGTLVLGGNIDVLGSMTHTSKATFATTGDASDLGTESGSGFASSLDVYSVVEGNSATGSATWTVDDQAAHYDSGKVSLMTGKDTTTWWMNTTAAYSTISGNFVTDSTTTLALNTEGGTLQLDTDPGVTLVSKKASTVEIADTVTLNANQLDASAADVTLTGSGSYTMADGTNTLGAGVSVGSDWRGTVNTTGNTTALALDKLGVSGSKVELGNATHILAARDQEVAASLYSTGSISLSGNKLTLSGENTLGSLNAGSLAITGGSTTITNGLTTGGESSVATGATLSIGGNSTLGGKITNGGTLVLSGNIDVLGSMTHTSKATFATTGDASDLGTESGSGFASSLDVYSVVEGNSATGSATWTVDGQAAHYDSGKVSLMTGKDTTTWWMNAAAAYSSISGNFVTGSTTTLALNTEGGTLQLDTDPEVTLVSKKASTVEIGYGVTLNAARLNTSAADVTLSGSGSYTLESGANALNTGVGLSDTGWRGTVNTTGNTTALELDKLGVNGSKVVLGNASHTLAARHQEVAADLNSTGSMSLSGNKLTLSGENTLGSLNAGSLAITGGSTTITNGLTTGGESSVATGATLSLSGNSTLGGKISNSGTLVLGGNIDVLGSMTHTSKATFATTGDASDLGTESGSGFASSLDVYSVVEGNSATGSATWTVDDQAAHYDSGKVSLLTGKDTSTWWMNAAAAYSTISGNFVTGSTTTLALNTEGGTLQLDTDPGVTLVSKKASTVEIADTVTLNAARLNASAADVTLSGSGSYTLESGANALNTGLGLSDTGWRGTVNTTGNTTALELDKLGVSGSKVVLGNASHTLAARDQEVAASLNSTGSVSLEGKELSLSGSNTLGSLSVGTLKIAGGSTAISGGLTTTGESSVADGANLSIGGVSSIGGKITLGSGSSLVLAGTITLDTTTFKPGDAVEEVTGYFIGDATKPNSTQSGFKAACWDITIAEGGSITDNGVTWQLAGDAAADFDFVETDGTLHAYGSSVESVFHVAQSDTITYDSNNAAVFVNRKDTEATAISLNGGTLVLNTDLRNTADDYVKSTAASTIEIGNDVTLKARQLDASAADVTLRGNGSYTLEDGANTLGEGVNVGTGWTGTVNTTGDTSALELDTLGVSGSVVELGSDAHTLEARDQSVAAHLSSTGSVSLEGKKLTLSGSNTLGSLNVGSLAITGGSTTITNGLTIGGESSVTTGATLSLSGNSTLGGKITNSGTLELGGNITVNKDTFKPGEAVENVIGYFIGSNTTPNSTNSGFEAACWDITIAEGGTITDKGATWKLVGDENATFNFAADGTLHAYGSGVGTVFHVAGGDTITYNESNAADFVNSKGEAVSAIQLNGGTLELGAALDTTVKSAAASSVVIADGVNLDASQLDASAAAVTLSGKGSYTLGASANALNTGVGLGSDWSGTLKLTGAADALELSSLGNALSSIDLGSFNHTLADGEHVIDSALMGSGCLTLNKGSKLTLNGDCSNWSGDIIGQVELELTEGGTIGGNVQVDSLHIGESSTTFEGNLTTTGTITVSENATLSMNGNTTLGGTIESADSGKVELAGQITVDVENFKSSTEVKDVTGYFIGNATTPNSTNSGFEAACWDITIAEGGTITDKGATWKLVGDENATFDFAADGTLHAYGSGVGTVFHVAEGDTITYSESNAADFVNSKGEAVSAIQLNGGTLELGAALATTVKSAATSSVVIADGVTLNASQLDTSAADVTLSGEGSYTMQGQELSGVVELNTGVELDTNEWKGTVYTGSTAQGAALDITALGNSQSTVYLGAQPMRRSMPGETVLESLTAAGVGTTETPGSLTLQKGTSTADALVVNGILTLGSTDAAAGLVADSVSLQGLSFAHADSSLVAGSLEGATTLNVQLTDEVLSNMDAGETLTLVTLEEGFEGTLTFNGSTETERVRSEDNRKEYTLAWNEAGTALTLTILGTETYVAEQVKPTTHNGKAGVALMTDVFLNSRPQKDAPEGALAGILNAVDAGTATDRDMAAVAGASTAALGMALSGDVERQLRAIRNRSLAGNDASTTTLVDEKSGMMSAEAPARFFAWVNAEGNRAEQNGDSTAAGYTLTSWGGTLGAGMQVNNQLTLGLALTAMYGDLQSDGPDYLKGDMDTAYLSAFARYNRGKWSHAFIGTVGTMEADYKRSAMSYSTDGDTDGTAFGLMYEVSREFELGNLSTLSPVLNIAYRHTAVDSYSESGADAALNVGKQSMDTVTLGAGARYAAVVGQQTLNRACGFEARALVKYDLGDRQSTTSTGFINRATRAGIESAELGSFGMELGAGISVPVGTGSIFADGAVELRSDYTNFNATVGYRIQF